MKALVVGYGSAGTRHARVLEGLGLDVAIVTRREFVIPQAYPDIPAALDAFSPDYVVIASRTSEHEDNLSLLSASGFTGMVLVEKPLFETARPIPENGFLSLHIAYNLRFHPAVSGLRDALADRRIYAVHAYVGQYLPDWRPAQDYRQSYSANAAQGGGVLRDLSHEIDFLGWICGDWIRVTAIGGHFSALEIDSDDLFSILAATARCPAVSINMNYLDSSLRREVIALTDQGTCRADLVRGVLETMGKEQNFATGGDDTYRAQHQAVFAGEWDKLCTGAEGMATLRVIAAAERAAAESSWITP